MSTHQTVFPEETGSERHQARRHPRGKCLPRQVLWPVGDTKKALAVGKALVFFVFMSKESNVRLHFWRTLQVNLSGTLSPRENFQAVINQKIELVLTAHPTEAQRRSALKKHEQMLQQMKVWDVGRAPPVAGGEYKVEYAVKRDCWEWQLLLDLNYSMIYSSTIM